MLCGSYVDSFERKDMKEGPDSLGLAGEIYAYLMSIL